jgi:hypothetical protein
MAEKLLTHNECILPHLLWAYFTGEAEMTSSERIHLLDCEDCQDVFFACADAETFRAAITRLGWKESA